MMLEEARRRQMLGQERTPKIGFESMAKTVAKRWRELNPEALGPYQKLAQVRAPMVATIVTVPGVWL